MEEFNWRCPYCGHHQTVTHSRYDHDHTHVEVAGSVHGTFGITHKAICCANAACKQVTLDVQVRHDRKRQYDYAPTNELPILRTRLMPESEARPQPDYIPAALREDYREACLIRDKSPKAAATLARRCLQGMIRDFCGISRTTLKSEIDALNELVQAGKAPIGVSPESVEAIDHVRSVGNIGAHMEADIDLIVPVDPGEAQALIELIELLFDEWYVARKRRQDQLARIAGIAEEKKKLITDAKAQAKEKKESKVKANALVGDSAREEAETGKTEKVVDESEPKQSDSASGT